MNSNPSNPPLHLEFQAKEPPMHLEFQNATRGRGMDIFWNYPFRELMSWEPTIYMYTQGIADFWGVFSLQFVRYTVV